MINSIVLVGRAGKEPEMKYFESGKIKTTFSLAVNRPTKEKETDWFDIELWGRTAEIAGEYVHKGSLLGIEGRIDFSKWTNDEGPQCRVIVVGQNMRLLGGKKDNEGAAAGEPERQQSGDIR